MVCIQTSHAELQELVTTNVIMTLKWVHLKGQETFTAKSTWK